jgi:hypothetical protein
MLSVLSGNLLKRSLAQLMREVILTVSFSSSLLRYPTIIVATRRDESVPAPGEKDTLRVMNWPQDRGKSEVDGFPKLVDDIGFDMPQKALSADGWQLEPQAKRGLLERIRTAGMPLGQYVEGRFYRGILTGLNDAFVIDGPTKNRLIVEHASSAEIIKPFLRGRDIKRWRVESQDLWLIFVPWHFPLHFDRSISGASAKAEHQFKASYPAIYRHLEGYKEQLWARNKAETGVRYEWYALQRWASEYWEEFQHPKIVVPAIQNKVGYASDLTGFFGNDKTSIIVSERWSYLLAVLNSPVSWWLTQQLFASKQGGFYEFKPMYVAQVPIPSSSERKRDLIDGLVRAIVAGSSDSRLEQLLNGFVYELFFEHDLHVRGLTLFDEAEGAGVGHLATMDGASLVAAAEMFATIHLVPGARLRTMLSDLQTLDVVRLIEDRE